VHPFSTLLCQASSFIDSTVLHHHFQLRFFIVASFFFIIFINELVFLHAFSFDVCAFCDFFNCGFDVVIVMIFFCYFHVFYAFVKITKVVWVWCFNYYNAFWFFHVFNIVEITIMVFGRSQKNGNCGLWQQTLFNTFEH
jgi:hypothetical protein